jgi:hypothetical protein
MVLVFVICDTLRSRRPLGISDDAQVTNFDVHLSLS